MVATPSIPIDIHWTVQSESSRALVAGSRHRMARSRARLLRSWSLLGIAVPLAGGCTPVDVADDGAIRGRCDHRNSISMGIRESSFEEVCRERDVTAKEFNGCFVSDVTRLPHGKWGWFVCPDCLSP